MTATFDALLTEATKAAKGCTYESARRTDPATMVSVLVFSQNRNGGKVFTQQWNDADGNKITKAAAAALLAA